MSENTPSEDESAPSVGDSEPSVSENTISISENSLSIKANNSLGDLLLEELQIEARNTEEEAAVGYAVADIEVSGTEAVYCSMRRKAAPQLSLFMRREVRSRMPSGALLLRREKIR